MTSTQAARIIAISVCCALGGIFLASLISGCADAPRIEIVNGFRVLQVPGADCPSHPEAAGCFERVDYAIFYLDEPSKRHEIDHIRGLAHGPWQEASGKKCALILAGGDTRWIAGQWICRAQGDYYAAR